MKVHHFITTAVLLGALLEVIVHRAALFDVFLYNISNVNSASPSVALDPLIASERLRLLANGHRSRSNISYKTRDLFQSMAENGVRTEVSLLEVARLSWELGQREEAIAIWRTVGAGGRFANRCSQAVEKARRLSGLWGDAQNACELAVSVSPGLSSNWEELAVVYQNLGMVQEVVSCYQKASELPGGERRDCQWRLAVAYQAIGEHERALEVFSKLLAREPNDAALIFAVGLELYFSRKDKNAFLFMERAIKAGLQPDRIQRIYVEKVRSEHYHSKTAASPSHGPEQGSGRVGQTSP